MLRPRAAVLVPHLLRRFEHVSQDLNLMEILAHVAQMPAVWAAVAVVAVLFAFILVQPRRPRAIVSGLFVYPVKCVAFPAC